MTAEEFDIEFDLLYNNINSNQSPGLNALEKSIFLTQAQDMVVKEIYEKIGFENDESAMESIAAIVKSSTIPYAQNNNEDNWYTFKKPENLLYIVHEKANTEGGCGVNKTAEVIPVKLDDINKIIRNPFRKSNGRRVLRVIDSDGIKLYSEYEISKYTIKYIEIPPNIVLPGADEYGVTGYSSEAGCILNENIHRTILLQAVQIAQSAWK